MKKNKRIFVSFLLLLFLSSMLTACSTAGKKEEQEAKLVLGMFAEDSQISRQVNIFNEAHTDVQIEIRIYEGLSLTGGQGLETLKTEIAAGAGPDIINFGSEYSRIAVSGGITDDLNVFMEQDENFYPEEYFMNVLKAYEVNGRLCAMPVSFYIDTFVGTQKELGDRQGWTYEEMWDVYNSKKEAVSLYPGAIKISVFADIMYNNADSFINWSTGECGFAGEKFIQLLEFFNQFPEQMDLNEGFSIKEAYRKGEALLYKANIMEPLDMAIIQSSLGGEELNYIGQPVDEGIGYIAGVNTQGLMLGIGANSRHKDIAWEFIKTFMTQEYQQELKQSLPVHRFALEKMLEEAMTPKYTVNEAGVKEPVPKTYVIYEGEAEEPVYAITREEADALKHIIEQIQVSGATDYMLYNIILEEVAAYFSGDKTARQAADIIQSRVSVYVNERIG